MNKKVASLSLLVFFLFGFLFFLFYHRILTVHWHRYIPVETSKPLSKISCIIHYYQKDRWHQENRTIIKDSDQNTIFEPLLKAWSAVISEEVLQKPLTVEFCTANHTGTELFISFNRSPFLKKWSLTQKLKLLESLTKTLEPYKQSIKTLRLFCNHKPIKDELLDLTPGWNLSFTHEQNSKIPSPQKYDVTRIVIEPSGNKQQEGRKIGSSSERIVTLKLAYQLKKELEATNKYLVTIFRDKYSDEFDRLLKISKAQPNLYLYLAAYQESDEVHHATIAYYNHESQSISFSEQKDFIRHDSIMAYFHKESISTALSLQAAAVSHQLSSHLITTVLSAPIKPLRGIACSSIAIELGVSPLQEERNLNIFVADIIKQAIKTIALP